MCSSDLSKSWAVFDNHFACIKDFTPYLKESDALIVARAWVAERSKVEPEVVYPSISRMTVSTGRRRR